MSSWLPSLPRTSRRAALVASLTLSTAALASAPRAHAAEPAAKAPKPADRDNARQLVLEGDAFYERRDFARALERYSQAYRLMHVPTVGIEVIKAQTALGKLVEAQATAQEVAGAPRKRGEPSVFEDARQRAAQSNLRLTGMIPSLWLEVSPAGVVFEVEIDGVTPTTSPPYQLNPGKHQVRVRASGYQPHQLDLTLREAERSNRRADLVAEGGAASASLAAAGAATSKGAASTSAATSPPSSAAPSASAAQPAQTAEAEPEAAVAATPADAAPASRSSSPQTLGWVGLAVAGVAAGVGTYAGLKAFSSKPDCPNDTCTPAQQDDIDSSERMGTVANISVGIAVVTGALGIWALASSGDGDGEESASFRDLPVTVGLGKLKEIRISGRF